MLSSRDGSVRRVLYKARKDEAVEGGSLTKDGSRLYFYRFKFTEGTNVHICTQQIVSLNMETGRWRVIADGGRPAISPDGKRLAYVSVGGGEDCTRTLGSVVVRDLETGRERSWAGRVGTDAIGGDVMRVAWSPDSIHLALQRNIGDPYYEVRILDTRKGNDVLDAPLVSPRDESWSQPSFLDENTVLVASSGTRDDGVEGEHLIYSVKLDTGRRRLIETVPANVTSIDFDDARKNLLIVLSDFTKGKYGRSVWAWRDGRLTRIIRDGPVIQAIW